MKGLSVSIAAGIIWLLMQWGAAGDALDAHWTTAWVVFSLSLVVLFLSGKLMVESPLRWALGVALLVVVFVQGDGRSLESLGMHAIAWTLFFCRKVTMEVHGLRKVMTVVVLGLVMSLLAIAFWRAIQNGWGHRESYELFLPWAHRNICIESLTVVALACGHGRKRLQMLLWFSLGVLAFTYQARSALLMVGIWGVFLAFDKQFMPFWFRSLLKGGVLVVVLLQVVWMLVPSEQRARSFALAPDVAKTLDVRYNLNVAKSSSERMAIWHWTVSRVGFLGKGSGQWKWDAEYEVNQVLGKCNVAVRRAHSDVLQLAYELGCLPFLVLLVLSWPRISKNIRLALILLPMFLFSFSLERAETFGSLALLIALIPSVRGPKESATLPIWQKQVLHFSIIMMGLCMCSWWVAQDSLGKALSGRSDLGQWGHIRKVCVDHFPQDAALNHIDVILCTYKHALGETETAKIELEAFLRKQPTSISAWKAWGGIFGSDRMTCADYLEFRRNLGMQRPRP